MKFSLNAIEHKDLVSNKYKYFLSFYKDFGCS